jgi:hypothetical protein
MMLVRPSQEEELQKGSGRPRKGIGFLTEGIRARSYFALNGRFNFFGFILASRPPRQNIEEPMADG